MKNAIYVAAAGAISALGVVCMLALVSCSAATTKKVTNALIDLVLATCVAENPELGEVELQKACKYADDQKEVVQQLLASQKNGLARVRASAPAPACRDAGK